MFNVLMIVIAAFMSSEPGGGQPIDCLHPDPHDIYPYIEEQPFECSDECWQAYQIRILQYTSQYAGCVSNCAHTYPTDRARRCECYNQCAQSFIDYMSDAEAEMLLCMFPIPE